METFQRATTVYLKYEYDQEMPPSQTADQPMSWEYRGSVLDLRRGVAGLSLTDVTAFCPCGRHINSCLELVQSRKTCRHITKSAVAQWLAHMLLVLEVPGSISFHGEENFGFQTCFP